MKKYIPKPTQTIFQKKGVLGAIIMIALAFSFGFYYFLDQELSKLETFKLNQLNEKKGEKEPLKLTKEEYDAKLEEQYYISIINSINSTGDKIVSISKNTNAIDKLLGGNKKFIFKENKEYEDFLLKNFLLSQFSFTEKKINEKLKTFPSPFLQSKEITPDFFYYNLLESSEFFYIVALEDISVKPGKKSNNILKESIFGNYLNRLDFIVKDSKEEQDIGNYSQITDNKDKLFSNMKFVFVYKVYKKDLASINKEDVNEILSNLLIKTIGKQILKIPETVIVENVVENLIKENEIKLPENNKIEKSN